MVRFNFKGVCALAISAMLVAPATAEIAEGLVSYWPLNGDFVDVVGQNDGELIGEDEAFFDDGQFDQGIVLDGIDQFIEIGGDESEFDFIDQDFSISAWFRVDAFTKSWQALIAKGEGNRWRVHRRGGEGIMTWNGGNGDVPADINPPVDDEEIHHFVGVSIAGEAVQMYIDGELVSEGPAPITENNDQPVMIGENPDAQGRTWEGLIDDVAIWGRALDESEVGFLWNDGTGKNPTDVGVIPPIFVGGENTIGMRSYDGDQSNEQFGPQQEGVPGFSGRMVTFDQSDETTISDHTTAQDVLDEYEGTQGIGAYPVADLAGGGGTFGENLPYPNGVNDASQNDFVVELTADVTIPAGTYTIGFGSDDGGSLQIPGVEFLDSQNNDNFEDDEIRFEGTRGHGWTAGTFELDEDLETSLVASFFERGGGDSFEIALLDDEILEDASPANGWELLGDGTFGWKVTTTTAPLISADLNASVSAVRPMQFDVNGDTGEADQLVLPNPDPEVFSTTLDVSADLTFQIKSAGTVTSGEAFTIIDADQIVGTPTITSVDPTQNWVFDGETGRVCLDICPATGLKGDYNGNGLLDAEDLDLNATVGIANQDLAYDLNADGLVNSADRKIWVNDLKNTWMGDANLNGVFDSGDLVTVFASAKYETGQAATWGQGDWNGDQKFDSGDLVEAFSNAGYEAGERPGGPNPVTAAVPEPSSIVLTLISLFGLMGIARRNR
ncbi:MAG: PEP-CTERM sorting domain-containing protein [Planctomycetaceae bacterium]|nr:PEP-CTERM sorting domain-containing protein [Planctomycetaceae bacterium]